MGETLRIEIPVEVLNKTSPGMEQIMKAFQQLTTTIQQVSNTTESTENNINGLANATNSAETNTRQFAESAERSSQRVSRYDDTLTKTRNKLVKIAKEKYKVVLEALDKVSAITGKVIKSIKSVTGKVWKVTMKAVDLATAPIRGIFNLLKNPIVQIGAVIGLSIGLKDTVDTYANFEAAMSKLNAVSGADKMQVDVGGTSMNALDALEKKAKKMGATTKFTAKESAEAFNYMGMAGWKAEQMLDGIEGILNLSAADGLDLATTSDIVTDALTAFGLRAADSAHFADVLAQTSRNANTNVAMMGETFKYVAPVAGSLGYNIEDTAVAIGLMANSGIKSSQAGTQLRAAMVNMVKPSKDQKTKMDLLGISVIDEETGNMKSLMEVMLMLREKMGTMSEAEQIKNIEALTGMSVAESGKESMQGMSKEEIYRKTALGIGLDRIKDYDEAQLDNALRKNYDKKQLKAMKEADKRSIVAMYQGTRALEGLTEAEQANAAATIFGKEAMSGWLSIINTSEEDFKKLVEAIEDSDGAAKEMAEINLDNLLGSFTLLNSAADGVKLTIGERLKPYIEGLVNFLIKKMPDIEVMATRFFNWFDKKVDGLKNKIAEFTSTSEWQRADFFGKVSIAWDEIIAKPFVEWWDSTGHDLIVGKAGSIGRGIGTAISTGLLALLGVDISGAIGEGQSVGSAFAKGLINGFDIGALKDKVWEGIKNIFSNASKILPGGEEADLSSWISAAMIAKVGLPLLGVGFKGIGLGKSIFGSTAIPAAGGGGSIIVPGIGRRFIGSAAAGTGLLGFGANTAIKLGAGNLAGGASLSAGGLSALGLGAIAGGAVGGATLISGGMDFYNAFKANKEGNKERAVVEMESGAWKVGGVAAGAATGATIGSVVPVLGTAVGGLIGAGVGGIAGWIKGDSVKKDYEKSLKEAQEAAEAMALAEEQAKYESQELKNALADASMTAEEFGAIYEKEVMQNLKDHFGDIKLSLSEVEALAKSIVFGDNTLQLEKFSKASVDTESKLSSLKNTLENLDRINWKIGLGVTLSQDELEDYKLQIDNLVSNAKKYLEGKHYEFTASVELLLKGEKNRNKLLDGVDDIYKGAREQLKTLNEELQIEWSLVLEGGEDVNIEAAMKRIKELEDKIRELTSEFTEAEAKAKNEANYKLAREKYSGSELDADSYAETQAAIKADEEQAITMYDEAYRTTLEGIELKNQRGYYKTDKDYREDVSLATEGYHKNIKETKGNTYRFFSNTLLEDYNKELENMLSQIEGTAAQKLQYAAIKGLETGVAPADWDSSMVMRLLGLTNENLPKETQEAITRLFRDVADSLIVDESSMEYLLSQGIDADYSVIGEKLLPSTEELIKILKKNEPDFLEASNQVYGSAEYAIRNAFSKPLYTEMPVNVNATYTLTNPTFTPQINTTYKKSNGASISLYANGGILDNPHVGMVAEDGPEAIIPLSGKRRSRGLDLWKRAGELLGVKPYANGGIVGKLKPRKETSLNNLNEVSSLLPKNFVSDEEETTKEISTSEIHTAASASANKNEIKIDISVNPQITINNTNSNAGNEIEILKEKVKEALFGSIDELSDELATRMQMIFSNMPVREG